MKRFFSFFFILILSHLATTIPLKSMSSEGTMSSEDDASWLLCTDESFSDTSFSKENVSDHRYTPESQALRRNIHISDRYNTALAKITATIKKKSTPLLKTNSEDHPNAVVLDVDDTTLLSPGMLALIDPTSPFPKIDQLLPVPSMIDLCNFFAENNCTFIFITARKEDLFEHTMHNLLSVGYTINRLLCMPQAARERVQDYITIGAEGKASELIARWKSLEIEDLMSLYNIVAVIDDSEDNIAAAERLLPGRCFKVPCPDEV